MIGAAILSMRAAALASAAFMARGFLTLLNPLALVRGAVFGIGLVIRGVAYATGIGALIAAGTVIYENWDNVRVAFEAFKGAFLRAIKPVRPILGPIIQDIGKLWDMVSGLIQPTGDMGAKWAEVGMQIGTVLGKDLVPWAGSIRAAWDAVKGMGEAWSTAVGIITSDDPIGRAVTLLTPKFNALVTGWAQSARDAWMNVNWERLGYDAVKAIGAAITAAGSAIIEAFKGLAGQGGDGMVKIDWGTIGTRIRDALTTALKEKRRPSSSVAPPCGPPSTAALTIPR